MQEFYSNGKLLITGEYLVLHGARALALPTKYGQSMRISDEERAGFLVWEAWENNEKWFEVKYNISDLNVFSTSDNEIAAKLKEYIFAAKKINKNFLTEQAGIKVVNKLNFDREWGLGSISTLISNIAYWADIDPYELYFAISSGSGYDIACARSANPILYSVKDQEPDVRQIKFDPSFKDKLYFVYLERKQDSAQEVREYMKKIKPTDEDIQKVSELTEDIIDVDNLETFMRLMAEHEGIISNAIGQERIKNQLFKDFDGEIKSLGAWGGDFILVASNKDYEAVRKYFKIKKYNNIFKFEQMLLT